MLLNRYSGPSPLVASSILAPVLLTGQMMAVWGRLSLFTPKPGSSCALTTSASVCGSVRWSAFCPASFRTRFIACGKEEIACHSGDCNV